MSSLQKRLSRYTRMVRLSRGITLTAVAIEVNSSKSYLARVEQCLTSPSVNRMDAIARAIGFKNLGDMINTMEAE